MRIIYQKENVNFPPCIATVGFFDGVHTGHRFLIEELKTLARVRNLKSAIITFAVHPRKVLKADFQPKLLTTLSEKLKQLGTTDADICVVLDFTAEMAGLSAYEFLKTILKEHYNVQALLVGHDHRFGHNRTDGFAEYKKYGEQLGMEVIQAERFSTSDIRHISSSTVRLALQQDDISTANRILTYAYSLTGKVTEGFKVGRGIGFPTANLQVTDSDKLIPSRGVYAVRVHWNGAAYKGMMNIGTRPTLTNSDRVSLEVNIFDFDEDIYNQTLEVEFIQKIRDEQKFNGVDELAEQLKKDREKVLGID
jgi:riboflavin kinase/FMN adenylyltransferase